jgi:hypothetical protein
MKPGVFDPDQKAGCLKLIGCGLLIVVCLTIIVLSLVWQIRREIRLNKAMDKIERMP